MEFVGGIIQNGISNMVSGAMSGAVSAGGEYAGDLVVGAGDYIEGGGRYVGDSVSGYIAGYGDSIKTWGGTPSVGHGLNNIKAGSGPTAPSLKRSLSMPTNSKTTGTVKAKGAASGKQSYASAAKPSSKPASKPSTGTGAQKALPGPQPLKGSDGKPLQKKGAPPTLKAPDGKPLKKNATGSAPAPAPLKGPNGQPLKKASAAPNVQRPAAVNRTAGSGNVGSRKYSDSQTKNLYGGQGSANKKVTTAPNVGKVASKKPMAKK